MPFISWAYTLQATEVWRFLHYMNSSFAGQANWNSVVLKLLLSTLKRQKKKNSSAHYFIKLNGL